MALVSIIRISLETPNSGLSPHSLSEEDGDNMRARPVRKHCDTIGCTAAGKLRLFATGGKRR
jgi:hypothetical protein